ncbi:MAG TPA: electron transporter RnfB [Spirochaetaceae bacterium]|nr:electron transporter RnfB [Spirochaetaceae bacterium]
MGIVMAFVIMLALSAALALFLAFADKKLKVEKNEKLEALEKIMPGANCGGCGFAGCAAYAEAVSKGEAEPGLCSPGGDALAAAMSEIMGKVAQKVRRMTAFVFCKGDDSVAVRNSEYSGLSDCRAASLVFNGSKGCRSGCLQLGSCMKVCSQNAISYDEKGDVVVDRSKCIGCGKCVSVCPNNVIKLIPYDAKWVVACNNKQKGAEVNKVCKAGCIGCSICVSKYPDSGCRMDEFLSIVDYDRDYPQTEQAAAACPRHIIRGLDK